MRTNLRQTCAAVLVAVSLSLGVPACGARIDPNATPQQVEQAQLRDLQRIAQVTERVGVLVKSLQDLEVALHNAGRISHEDHRVAQTYFRLSAEMIVKALEDAKDITKPANERASGIVVALRFVDRVQTEVIDKLPDQQVRMHLQLALMGVQMLLSTMQLQL